MGELRRGSASVLVAAPAALVLVYLGGWPLAVGVALLGLGGAAEAGRLLARRGAALRRGSPVAALVFWAADVWAAPAALPVLVALAVGGPALFRRPGILGRAVGTVWAGGYAAGLLGALLPLRAAGMPYPLLVLTACWGTDVAAYLTGRAFGRHRLWPRLSPAKSWEGAAGGWLCGGAAVWAVGWGFGLPREVCLLWATLLPLVAQAGDLAESALKRWAQVKDSGSFLPGHGGVLDRLDSVLAVAPVAYLLLWGWGK